MILPAFFRRRESLTEANTGEMRDAIRRLIALSTNDYGYYLFLTLSILITTAGLLLSSAPVIIGGMIIAPILTPLLGCGLGVLLLEIKGFIRALSIIVFSVIVALILSAATTIVTLILEPITVVIEFVPQNIAPGLYFLVAFCSGIAGAFAFVKSYLSSSISGVAVSASLIPPLCSIGIGIALKDISLVGRSFTIFLLNFVGIVAAAAIVFWILGFRKARALEEKVVEAAEND